MKVSIKKIVSAQKRLDTAKVTKLEEVDAIKLLKNRKAMRPYVTEYEEFEKDCREKFKVDGLEDADKTRLEVFNKVKDNKAYQPTQEEVDAINKVADYFNKVNKALSEELGREVEITFEKLSDNADVKLMQENGWSYAELDEIEVIL